MKITCKTCKKPILDFRIHYNIRKQGHDITIICSEGNFFDNSIPVNNVLAHLRQDWEIEL